MDSVFLEEDEALSLVATKYQAAWARVNTSQLGLPFHYQALGKMIPQARYPL